MQWWAIVSTTQLIAAWKYTMHTSKMERHFWIRVWHLSKEVSLPPNRFAKFIYHWQKSSDWSCQFLLGNHNRLNKSTSYKKLMTCPCITCQRWPFPNHTIWFIPSVNAIKWTLMGKVMCVLEVWPTSKVQVSPAESPTKQDLSFIHSYLYLAIVYNYPTCKIWHKYWL